EGGLPHRADTSVPRTENKDEAHRLPGHRVRLDAPPTPFPDWASLVAGHEPPKPHPHPPVNRQLSPGLNLTHRSFQSDREAVIRRAVAAGVIRLVNTGTTIRGSQGGLALSRAHPGTVTTTAAFPARLAARLPRWKHQPQFVREM